MRPGVLVLALAAPCVGKAQQLPGDASFQQALLLEKQGKLAEAEAALERARQDEPANLEVLTELGKVESRIGKHSQAIDYLPPVPTWRPTRPASKLTWPSP